jgi:hypothetical protein
MASASFELTIDGIEGPLDVRSLRGTEELSRAWAFDLVVSGAPEREMERVALGRRATVTLQLNARPRALYGVPLYALAAARVIDALPLFRAKWPYVATRQLETRFADVVATIAMKITNTDRLPPIGDISSHNIHDVPSKVQAALTEHTVTALELEKHACWLGDIQYLQHNWAVPEYFHEILDDAEPETDASLAKKAAP